MTDSQDPSGAPTRRSMRGGGKPSKPSASPAAEKGADASRAGIGAVFAKHPRAWLASALGVAFLLLGTAAVFAGLSAGSNSSAAVVPSASAYPARPQPSAFPSASRLRTCSVAPILADGRLSAFAGYVARADTGEVLLDRNGEQPQRTGSVLKTLTAAAALSVLGPSAQLSTRVILGSTPGSIVLQGGGDPTLASTNNSYYTGAPRIADLATAAMAAYKATPGAVLPITTIILDSTMWDPADNWDSSWDRDEQYEGYQSEVTALMIDGGRADPSSSVSERTGDPVGDAGRAFANAAGLNGVTFTTGAAIGSTVLAEVKSQPLSTLIDQMLKDSDNVLAEMLARVVSKTMGFNGGSASLAQAIPGALVAYDLPTTTITIRDGSGLSDLNSVSPQFISLFMAKVLAGVKDLGVVLSSLPVAGQSGTLSDRFIGDNAAAAGAVLAKTGMLVTEYALGGIIHAQDGTPLVFAFYSIRDGITSDTKDAQDSLATAIFRCGDNLSNN